MELEQKSVYGYQNLAKLNCGINSFRLVYIKGKQ